MSSAPNPLLQIEHFPQFDAIQPQHVEPAITQILAENKALIEKLLQENPRYSWNTLIAPMDEADDRLSAAWSPVSHLNAVMNSDELRKAYNACLPKLSEYATELGQHKGLFEAYKSLHESSEFQQLSTAQQKAITNALRDFHLSGIDLPEEKQARYKSISSRLSELHSKFSENVLDATQAWSKQVTAIEDLKGVPESALALAEQTAKQKHLEGWVFTLDFPSYQPIVTYCENRELRKEMYEAYVTRASDAGPNAGQRDNKPLMDEILALRHELAQLLNFNNYAEYSLAKKMARSPDEVLSFLNDLADKALPFAKTEWEEIKALAKQRDGLEKLQAWDVSFYAELLRQQKYAISQEQLRPWFPINKVLNGLFDIAQRVFAIQVQEKPMPHPYHPDVKFFALIDETGKERAHFYLDLYARDKKRGGAWMGDCKGRRLTLKCEVQTPVAYLVCNFTPAVAGKPALLTHNEVLTLFHEFGHGLHHMLTEVNYSAVAGINGVAWDAVELPSQFMENFCWEPEGIALISGHYETGEALPEEMLQKMLAAKNFQAAMMMLRQLEFALFDFRIHTEYKPGLNIQSVLDEVRKQVTITPVPAFNRFQNSFSHIFAGGYAAGYYSYKWAEVLSADAFSKFEEEGIFNPQTGKAFRSIILAQGGSKEPMDLFVEFRGRPPQVDALLRHSGLKAA
ncbi:MAG TPA: oligopeptidase A [Pseudomonadales bacterium]|nr:oligopeptidase A [Pseudomonadales bacterium]